MSKPSSLAEGDNSLASLSSQILRIEDESARSVQWRRAVSRSASPNLSNLDVGPTYLNLGVEKIATEIFHHPVVTI